jgi:hypothetical protein
MSINQFFTVCLLFCAFGAMAQVPQAFNYQAVVRDAQGNPLSNQTLNFEVSIVQNNAAVYGETQSKTTNLFGLVDIKVGQGTVFQGTFAGINWGNGAAMIRVKMNGVILPESPIVPVPIALYALRSGGSTTDSWALGANNINRVNGNVGIGTNNPETKLTIEGDEAVTNVAKQFSIRSLVNNKNRLYIGYHPTKNYGSLQALTEGVAYRALILNPDGGNVGIGVPNPSAKLSVNGTILTEGLRINGSDLQMGLSDGRSVGNVPHQRALVHDENDVLKLNYAGDFEGGVIVEGPRLNCQNLEVNGTIRSASSIYTAGQGSFSVVEVRGADIVEKFNSKETIEAGTLVTIDAQDINNYKTTEKAYQKGIVGIVSGANGVNHGMLLQQDDVLAGNTKVAIAGRVYVKATAQNGAIKAGDMLTSSDKAGFAMKATSQKKAFGSVVGKALTSLESGEGFVLVLVGLQ